MIFPGGLLLLAILSTGNMHDTVKDVQWVQYLMQQTIFAKSIALGLVFVLFAYLLGIALHTLVTIWRAFWETRKWSLWKMTIRKCYEKEIYDHTLTYSTDSFFGLFQNDNGLQKVKDIETKELQYAYFKAQKEAKMTKREVLTTIEQQVAMLRNCFVPCLWLLILALQKLTLSWWMYTLVILGYVLIVTLIIWAREYKIFAIVMYALTYDYQTKTPINPTA